MLKPRTLILFGIACLLALAAAVVAHRWVSAMQDPSRHYDQVVVAAREISFLSPISEFDVKVIEFPKGNAPAESLSDLHQAIGKIVTQDVRPGEVLLASRVRDHLGGSLLAHALPNNARAVSVRVNDVSGVGGFILPGSLVDMLVSRKYAAGQAATETIVNAAKVMAVGQETSAEKQSPMLVQVVTLELSPSDAERVVQATAEGAIHLVLRNPGDHSVYLPHRLSREKPEAESRSTAAQAGPAEKSLQREAVVAVSPHRPSVEKREIPDKPGQQRDIRRLIKGTQEVWVECTPTGCADRMNEPKAGP